jgi:hypothetical protein
MAPDASWRCQQLSCSRILLCRLHTSSAGCSFQASLPMPLRRTGAVIPCVARQRGEWEEKLDCLGVNPCRGSLACQMHRPLKPTPSKFCSPLKYSSVGTGQVGDLLVKCQCRPFVARSAGGF